MNNDGLSAALRAVLRGDLTDVQRKTREQERLAAEGRAEGLCACGSYRADGAPPILHYPECAADPSWIGET